ncbi:MAG: tRNA (adenosine(37)-N6)-threonylcarbamoyltransferase complex ATPase subunit type 1 TsaE [Pseudomonadota bacterium]
MPKLISSPEEMEEFGASIIKNISPPACVYLRGDLGAGKTTLVRGALRELGYQGLVKSPTFTLVESYSLPDKEVHHFDLYRISDPEELDYLGLSEYQNNSSICFFEWPDLGKSMVPKATIEIDIQYDSQGRRATVRP